MDDDEECEEHGQALTTTGNLELDLLRLQLAIEEIESR